MRWYDPVNWPINATGDVFRSLAREGFDFKKQWLIDFNIDFESWPPSPDVIAIVRARYPSVTVYNPNDEDPGYVLVQVYSHLDYELVVRIQHELTELAGPFGGVCESWGVLH